MQPFCGLAAAGARLVIWRAAPATFFAPARLWWAGRLLIAALGAGKSGSWRQPWGICLRGFGPCGAPRSRCRETGTSSNWVLGQSRQCPNGWARPFLEECVTSPSTNFSGLLARGLFARHCRFALKPGAPAQARLTCAAATPLVCAGGVWCAGLFGTHGVLAVMLGAFLPAVSSTGRLHGMGLAGWAFAGSTLGLKCAPFILRPVHFSTKRSLSHDTCHPAPSIVGISAIAG